MKLSGDAAVFQAKDGSVVIYGDVHARLLLLSEDGQKFREVKQRGFNGTTLKHEIFFEDPHTGRLGGFRRDHDVLEFDGKTYGIADLLGEIEVMPLPNVRQSEYLFEMPGGQYLYVSASKFGYSYESFKLFIGPAQALKQVPIRGIQRLRDGGTTDITTDIGELYSPTPFRQDPATWGTDEDVVKLKKLDPAQFKIVEGDTDVRIEKQS